MMSRDKLIEQFKTNCYNLLKNKKIINERLWPANPWPINEYFILYNKDNTISEIILDEMLKLKIGGIEIEKIKDTGWNCLTIIARKNNEQD